MSSKSKKTNTESLPIDRLNATLGLEESVDKVKGVSAARAKVLEKLQIRKVRDLLMHYPRRYMDLSTICSIADAEIGKQCTITGRIHEIKLKRPRPRLPIVEFSLVDGTGTLIVSVFHQPWLMDKLKAGDEVAIAGKVEFNYGFKRMTNPFLEPVAAMSATGRIIPIHPATEKISAKLMRNFVEDGLRRSRGMFDPVPIDVRLKRDLMGREQALRAIHFPGVMDEIPVARERLAYEELLMLQLYVIKKAKERSMERHPIAHVTDGTYVRALREAIPFTLTSDQEDAIRGVFSSMASDACADHMVLGDVGTGKTIVAAFAIAAAADTGKQAFFLAPTEVLATQHSKTLGDLFDAVGIKHALLTGSTSAHDRASILEKLSAGEIDVLIGTHAILEDDVVPHDMSLAIIDEQQRFGVNQRAKLLEKSEAPDALYLTATPIPRSLALALFGNLELSYIKERPHKEAKRTTKVLARQLEGEAYDAALQAVQAGFQAYVVCPLISSPRASAKDEDDKLLDDGAFHPQVDIDALEDEAVVDLVAAKKKADILQKTIFAGYAVGLLHGEMSSADKAAMMQSFVEGDIDILVSTTVVEVGVDVPNATVMIVEDADRFGLSQLHQLRGRVGRGNLDSQVFLISSTQNENAISRLLALETCDDGFELAKFDLSLRREGDVLGNRQSGASSLRLVNLEQDEDLIEWAHEDALSILDADPALVDAAHAPLARELRMVFPDDLQTMGG